MDNGLVLGLLHCGIIMSRFRVLRFLLLLGPLHPVLFHGLPLLGKDSVCGAIAGGCAIEARVTVSVMKIVAAAIQIFLFICVLFYILVLRGKPQSESGGETASVAP